MSEPEPKDDHVAPQDPARRNSQIAPAPIPAPIDPADDAALLAVAAKADCYWNDKRYSDGGTVCDARRRYKCWDGKWVDVGNC